MPSASAEERLLDLEAVRFAKPAVRLSAAAARLSAVGPLSVAAAGSSSTAAGIGAATGAAYWGGPYWGWGWGGYWWDPFWYGPYWGYPYYRYWDRGYYDNSAELRLEVRPKEAQVYVDGYYAGIVDDFNGVFQRLHVRPGRHELALYMPGYRTVRQNLYLSVGQDSKVKFDLVPLGQGEPNEPPPQPAAPPSVQEGYGTKLSRRTSPCSQGAPQRPARPRGRPDRRRPLEPAAPPPPEKWPSRHRGSARWSSACSRPAPTS